MSNHLTNDQQLIKRILETLEKKLKKICSQEKSKRNEWIFRMNVKGTCKFLCSCFYSCCVLFVCLTRVLSILQTSKSVPWNVFLGVFFQLVVLHYYHQKDRYQRGQQDIMCMDGYSCFFFSFALGLNGNYLTIFCEWMLWFLFYLHSFCGLTVYHITWLPIWYTFRLVSPIRSKYTYESYKSFILKKFLAFVVRLAAICLIWVVLVAL